MSHDHHNHAPDAVTHEQAPEAELPQAPPGAPEGHDASPVQAERPQAEAELQAQPGAPQPGASQPTGTGQDRARPGMGSPCDLDELAAKAEKADEYLALAQRTKADFENYRKRATREAAAAQERGITKLAKELLPAVDNLDRALQAAQAAAPANADGAGQADNGTTATLVSGI